MPDVDVVLRASNPENERRLLSALRSFDLPDAELIETPPDGFALLRFRDLPGTTDYATKRALERSGEVILGACDKAGLSHDCIAASAGLWPES